VLGLAALATVMGIALGDKATLNIGGPIALIVISIWGLLITLRPTRGAVPTVSPARRREPHEHE